MQEGCEYSQGVILLRPLCTCNPSKVLAAAAPHICCIFPKRGTKRTGELIVHILGGVKSGFGTPQSVKPQKIHSRSLCHTFQGTMSQIEYDSVVQNWYPLGVKQIQTTLTKQNLGIFQVLFSKCLTGNPVIFIWDSLPVVLISALSTSRQLELQFSHLLLIYFTMIINYMQTLQLKP